MTAVVLGRRHAGSNPAAHHHHRRPLFRLQLFVRLSHGNTLASLRVLHLIIEPALFYCPLKANRKVDDSHGKNPYKPVSELDWFGDEMLRGKLVKIHGFPRDYKVKVFRVAATNCTEYVVTNDLSEDSAVAVKGMCGTGQSHEQIFLMGNASKAPNRRAESPTMTSGWSFFSQN